MIQCPRCGAENRPEDTFCSECGARLVTDSTAARSRDPVSSDAPGDVPEKVPAWLQKLLATYGLVEPEAKEEFPAIRGRVAAPTAAQEPESWPTKFGEEPSPGESEASGEAGFTDWLKTIRSEGEDREQETAKPEEVAPSESEEAFDWLRGLRETEIEAEGAPGLAELDLEPSGEAGLEELPDWLRDLREPGVEPEIPLTPEQVPPPVETTETESEELPDWLRALGESGVEAEPAPTELPRLSSADEEELPEWLREAKEPLVSAEKSVPFDRLPDLDALEEREGELAESPFIAPEAPAEKVEDGEEEREAEIPGWLQELQQMEPTPAGEAPDEVTTPPDWLVQPTTSEMTIEAGEVPAPDWLQEPIPSDSEATDEEKELAPPDWLKELGPPGSPVAEAEDKLTTESSSRPQEPRPFTEAPVGEQGSPRAGEELEELVEILGPPVSEWPVTGPEGEPKKGREGETEGLAQADIPDWLLALHPQAPEKGPTEAQEIMEFSGPLAGIKGILPVEPIISLPHLTRPEKVAVAPSVSGDLFAETVAQPPLSTSAVPRQAGTRLAAGAQRVLIYLLLLAAVVVPLLMEPIYGPLDAAELQAGGESFYAVLDGRGGIALPADSAVIVAFDYNPATAAELTLQARAIVDHLMHRGVRIMAISLYPEGAALAWDVLDELATERSYVYGENYIHLGYLPNQPAAVRYFLDVGPAGEGESDYRYGRPVNQYPIAQGVDNLSSVSLVIDLAGDKDALRTWVEQITARAGVPVVAGASAAIAPYVQPYLDSGQLQALLVGLPGAAEYEAQTGQSGKAIESLGSQVAAQAVIVLLILLGNLVHLVSRGGKE